MTFDEWEPISRRLFGAFPNVKISPETLIVYFEHLEEFDADHVLFGVERCTDGATFLPTIAELREVIVPEHQVRREWDHLDFSHAGLPSGENPSPALPDGERKRLSAGDE